MRKTITFGALALGLAIIGCSSGSSSSKGAGSTAAPTTSNTTGSTTSGSTGGTTSGSTGGSTFTGTPGEFRATYQGRDYILHVPDSYRPTQPAPLAILFHGSGDSAANFWNTARASGWEAGARSETVLLLIPDTKSPFQSFPVWSGNPNNDIPQMQAELAEVLDLLQGEVAPRYNLQPGGVHAVGFSDGGLFLAAVGLASPDLATCSIFGYGWGGFYVTQPQSPRPVHMVCGTQDQFYAGANAAQQFLAAQGHDLLWEPVANAGHSFSQLSRAVGADASLAWLKARPTGGSAPPPPPTSGSGGTGGQPGMQTRQATTQAQAGLPSITVNYDLYVPATVQQGTPAPILFAANMGLTPWRQLADAEGLIVVDFRDHDRNGGFNFNYDVLLLNAVIADVESAYNVDTKRRYYHGFSAGAHWGYVVVLANANSFAGLGISAGSLGIARQQGVFPGNVQRRIPVAIRHGTQDAVVPVSEGQAADAALRAANHPVTYGEFAGGHTVSAADAQFVWNALKAARAP